MEFCGVYFPAFSHIQQIIPKSKFLTTYIHVIYLTDYLNRVLLLCIKFLGSFPCPRCLVKKDDIWKIGSKADHYTRETKARVDDNPVQYMINKARECLFVKGLNITSAVVRRLLTLKSLVPTVVSTTWTITKIQVNLIPPECILVTACWLWAQLLFNVRSRLHA